MPLSSHSLAILCALGAALTWGLGSLLFRRVLEHADVPARPTPSALNLFKNTLAAAGLALLWIGEGAQLPPASALPWLAASGFLGFSLGDMLYLAALPRAGVQAAAMVVQLHVPLAALLAFALFGNRLALASVGAIALVLAGVSLVLLDGRARGARDPELRRSGLVLAWCATAAYAVNILGLAWCATAAYAVNIVLGHRGLSGVALFAGSLTRVCSGMGGAFLVLPFEARGVPFARALAELVRPFREPALWRRLVPPSLCSVVGLPLFHYGLRELEPAIAAVLLATTPLFTLLLGGFFGERHGLRAWIGTLLGFAGVAGIVSAS